MYKLASFIFRASLKQDSRVVETDDVRAIITDYPG